MSSMELLLRVNGIQPAFGIELGFDSPRAEEVRATDPYRQANVSYSLVQRQDGHVVRHTLIDVGMGVVPSLLEFEHSHGVRVVHEVLITHPHWDHFAQLDWLSVNLVRNGRPDQPRPLPIYASRECWQTGPLQFFRHLPDRTEHRPLEHGVTMLLGDLSITPFAVDHGPAVPGALGFVVMHSGRKVIITGDFRRVVHADDPMLRDADVCFLEANTWHPIEGLAHQSVEGDLTLVEQWNPKRAYLIHYSGYEDRGFAGERVHEPLDLPQFRHELTRIAGGRDVRPAEHGMILGDTVAWPE